MYNSEQVKELLKKQRENCKWAYLRYYAGSEEDSAPQCVVDDIENAPEPEDFVLNDKRNVARGEEKSREESFENDYYDAFDHDKDSDV